MPTPKILREDGIQSTTGKENIILDGIFISLKRDDPLHQHNFDIFEKVKIELKSEIIKRYNEYESLNDVVVRLEKIKELVKELEYDYEEIAFTKFMFKLKKILEEKLQ